MDLYNLLKFLHVITVVFMAAPLYNLIVVNERVSFGKAHLHVDQYFENIIRGSSVRCYIFQLTALVTGVLLLIRGGSWLSLFTNWVLLLKLLFLLALTGLLSVVHFSIQPQIDKLLAQAEGDTMPQAVAAGIGPLRLKRKRLASVCLFLVTTTVLLGVQVDSAFRLQTTLILVGLAALFSWRVYRTRVPYGWV
ncbi:MAG: hypothetical protein HYX76_01175 [Acidobacteria bacterium]|nr:hypothetical protein [Acidobacteriota bacterium]